MSEIIYYISLGRNCTPRITIKNRFGFSKKRGYLSLPFDLCITRFDSLCEILENDFSTFFDGLKIIKWPNADGDRTLAGPGNTCIRNKAGIIFNHEGAGHSHLFKDGTNDDEFYTKNNFKNFRIRYSKRIQNIQNIFKKANVVTFVYTGDNFNENIIENIIKKKYNIKSINFIKV